MYLIMDNTAQARALIARLNAAIGYPKPGTLASSGRVVDPQNETGLGWTTTYAAEYQHPVDNRVLIKIAPPEETRLTAAEKLREAIVDATLIGEWFPV